MGYAVDRSPQEHPMPPFRTAVVLASVLLSACGAEVAGTAATVGALEVEQLKAAKAQQRQFEAQLGQAMQAAAARASEANP
ncbi:MAG: hypothetical protein OEW22_15315 [Rubrivivax sp.]|nr:hypothetical protein [Rubrivivax sp.]